MLDFQLLLIAISAVLLIFIAVACFLIFGNRERSFENGLTQKRGIYSNLVEPGKHDDGSSSHTAKKTNTKNTKKKKTDVFITPAHASSSEHKKPVAKKVITPEDTANTPVDNNQEKEADILVENGRQGNMAKKIKPSKAASNSDSPKADDGSFHSTTDNVKQKPEQNVIPAPSKNLPSSLPQSSDSGNSTLAMTTDSVTSTSSTANDETGVKVIKNRGQGKDATLEMPKTKLKEDSEENMSLKKTLEEKERFIQQQKDKLAKLTSTVKELKHEMFNEKQKQTETKQSFDDQLKLLRSENDNLAQKLRDAQNQVSFKVHTCHQLEGQILKLQENTTKMHQLTEENRRLKDCLKSTEHENLIHSNEFHRLQQELMNCKSHIHQLEQQRDETEKMRAVQDAKFALQLMDSQNTLMAKDNECAKLVEDLKTLRSEISLMAEDHRSARQEFSQKEACMQTMLSQRAVETDLLQESRKENAQLIEKENLLQSEIKCQRQMIGELTTKQQQDQALYKQQCAVKDANIEELNQKIDALNTELKNISAKSAGSSEPELAAVRYPGQENVQISGESMSSLVNGSASLGIQECAPEVYDNVPTAHAKVKNLKNVTDELKRSNAELNLCKEQMTQLHDKNLLLRNEKHKLVSIVQKTEKLVDQMLHNETKVASSPEKQSADHSDPENSHFRDRCGYYERILKETECRLQSLESKALRFEISYENDGNSWKNKETQLQNELGHREQHLEKEMAINKQLNNKLTSLGITFTC